MAAAGDIVVVDKINGSGEPTKYTSGSLYSAGFSVLLAALVTTRIVFGRSLSQHTGIYGDSGGNYLNSYSAVGNAKQVVYNSTTDELDTAPGSGACGHIFRVLGLTKFTIDGAGITVATGVPFTSAITVPRLNVNDAAGTIRAIIWQSSGVSRWGVYVDGVAEGGANTGSDFQIIRYSDAGGSLGNIVSIARSTGNGVFHANWSVDGVYQVNGTKVVGARDTGWTAMSGTVAASKGAHATITIAAAGAAYSQAHINTLVTEINKLSARVRAQDVMLRAHGLIN
jgi:hypothetical protein